jgi:hypothetical protein
LADEPEFVDLPPERPEQAGKTVSIAAATATTPITDLRATPPPRRS